MCCFFFFQAEDGIRDGRVTGVQTCALPISLPQTVFQEGWARHRRQRLRDRGRRRRHRDRERGDRKSTRLNSSHPSISYAVFCLKKKKKRKHLPNNTQSFNNL